MDDLDDLLNDLNTSKTAPAKRTSLQPQAARSQGSSSTSGSRPSAAPGVVPKSPSFAWADAESELDAIANALSPASQSNQNGQAELDAYGTHAGHGTSSYDEQQPPAEEWQQYEAPPEYLQQRSRAPSNAQQPQRTSRPPSMGSGTVPRSPAITSSAHDNLRQLVDNRPNGSRPEMAPRPSMAKSASGAANNREPQATCRACSKPILNPPVIKVAQGTYHADHFRCAGCNNQLQASGTGYFERQSKLWCESCAKELKYPRCAFCNEDITGKCVRALDTTWHPDHFFCRQCGKVFGPGEDFMEKDGQAYCNEDFYNMFAPKCSKCNELVTSNVISALGQSYHEDCFVCSDERCKISLVESGTFFEYNGQPYCEIHYNVARGSICASCQKPIAGRRLTAAGRSYHPEHFNCRDCSCQLQTAGGAQGMTYRENEGHLYCIPCHIKRFEIRRNQ